LYDPTPCGNGATHWFLFAALANTGATCIRGRLVYLRFLPVYRFIQRRSDLTIVTNKNLAAEVRRNGGNPIVLEDRVPKFDRFSRIPLEGKFNVVFICTFEKDEPYQEVVQSAHLLDPHVFIYVTGRHEKVASELVAAAPSNVIFTGFLSEAICENAMFIQ
jgi:hypothetical protein